MIRGPPRILGPEITVKGVALVAVPPAVVIVIGPVVAPFGTIAVTLVVMTVVTVAGTPLKATCVRPGLGSKPLPLTVTTVPGGPLAGAKPAMTGAGSVVKL